ncbi:MAG: aspartate carbamoyltransferase catalytic subunit [Rhodobacteraceae bacterium]|nr:aspartate carbamoyltransferase catalytic subunit [Paracoccaceae bacterium]
MFPFPHLLGAAELERAHIEAILDRADHFADLAPRHEPAPRSLKDRTLINLFFEPSTRTQASFELAAKRLGATVMNMSMKTSSMSKGETLLDTATTLNAMLPDILVVRHDQSGAVALLAEKVNCAVVNAGDGWHEHPTQALLDALTMRRAFRARRGPDAPAARLEGLTLAICGDVAHSRVARSNIFLHKILGNEVRVVAPPTLIPAGLDSLGVTTFHDMSEGVRGADVVMMLRLQNERMEGAFIPSVREYFHHYGLSSEEMSMAAPDALAMHPGPMNRGVEIDSELADDPARSVIATQVEMGVAVRMAVLELVAENLPHTAPRSERPAAPGPRPAFFGEGERRATLLAATAAEPAVEPQPTAYVNARLIDPETSSVVSGALLTRNGEIADVGPRLFNDGPPAEADVIDCGGLALGPGLVDMRVFIGEPGERHKESFGSGGESAIAGGVTTIVTQPETNPPVDDPALLDFIAQRVAEERRDHAMPRVRTMGALTKGLSGAQMAEYEFLLARGAVALTDGDQTVADPVVFRRCLSYAASLGALVCHYPQEPALSKGACATEGAFATRRGLPSAPAAAEAIMLERDLALVALTGARYHAAQISTAASVEALNRARARGLDVSAAVSIPHLLLCEDDVAHYRTFFKMAPPLRAASDRDAMIDGLLSGAIDCVVSSHRPQNEESKRLPFAEAAAGAVGVETLLSALLSGPGGRAFSLPFIFAKAALNPAKRLGLDAGRLSKGAPADLVLFDPEQQRKIDRRRLRSKSKNSPFDRVTLPGVVRRTVVAGRTVYLYDPETMGETAA